MSTLDNYFSLKSIAIYSAPLIGIFSISLIFASYANEDLFFLINQLAPNYRILWLNLTHLGDGLVAITLCSIFFLKHTRLLWSLVISILISIIVVQGLKHAIDAPRPPAVLPTDQIHVIVTTLLNAHDTTVTVDDEQLINDRADTSAVWNIIQSDPSSSEAHYWAPRMNGIVTKKQFGIAFAREALELEQGVYSGIYRPSTRSFPSGHATTIVCVVTLIILYIRKKQWTWILSLAGLMVAGTRIVVGVHWPIDVAVGGLIGCAIAILATWFTHNSAVFSNLSRLRLIVFLPVVSAIALLIRSPIYPEIARLEIFIGVVSLLFGLFNYQQLYSTKAKNI